MCTLAPSLSSGLNNYLLSNHTRSQSDSTNSKSSSFYSMTQPRSEDYSTLNFNQSTMKSIQSSSSPILQSSPLISRKRSFEDDSTSYISIQPINTTTTNTWNPYKKAKTAPSSPITYTTSPIITTHKIKQSSPKTISFKLPDLPLTPPLNPKSNDELYQVPDQQEDLLQASLSLSSSSHDFQSDSSDIPRTPPSSAYSSPKQFQGILKPSTKPVHIAEEAAFYFPDTCYSFNLVNSSINLNESNERGCFMEQQNEEWREYYSSKIKHENNELFKKYKDYCNDLKTHSSSSSSSSSSNSTKISKIKKFNHNSTLKPIKSSKLSKFIEHQYNKYNGLVDYPYANNYTYQQYGYLHDIEVLTSTPELYNYQPKSRTLYTSKENYTTSDSNQKFKLPSLPKDLTTNFSSCSIPPISSFDYKQVGAKSPKILNAPLSPLSPSRRHQEKKELTTVLPPIMNTTSRRLSNSSTTTTTTLPPIQIPNSSYTHETSPISKFITTTTTTLPATLPATTSPTHTYQQQLNYITSTKTPPNTNASLAMHTNQQQQQQQQQRTSPSSPNQSQRQCISCHSSQSPCWRPSWSSTKGQLCNSCGLRYKKTKARCLNDDCLRIPAKGEWTLMKNKGKLMNGNGMNVKYRCLHCDGEVAVDEA